MNPTDKKFRFIGIHLFPFFQYSIFAWVALRIAFYFFDIPNAFVLEIVLIFFYLGSITYFNGSIYYTSNINGQFLNIKTLSEKVKLKAPFKIEQLWTYDVPPSRGHIKADGPSSGPANNVVSLLVITDCNGQKVVLEEKIFLDSRFPNEAKYIPSFKEKFDFGFVVQRTDKTYDKLSQWIKQSR